MPRSVINKIAKRVCADTYIKYRNKRYLEEERNQESGCINLCHITHQLTGNSGDTVLSYCVRHTLQNFNSYSWTIFGVRNEVQSRDIDTFNNSRGIVVGGGGLFLPDSNKNSVSGWQWPCSIEQLSAIHTPIIIYSVGYNYFRGQAPSEFFVKNLNALIERADFIGLRNYGSINAVKELIQDDLKKKLVYQPCTTTVIRKTIKDLPEKRKSKKVAINIAYDRIEQRLGKDYEKVLRVIAQAVKEIYLRGYEIYCVAHCAFDLNFGKFLRNENVPFKSVDGEFWLPKKWFEFYNDMEVVLGMRGHAQMIPFGLNTKIISLGSHDKMRWFLEDIEAIDWYVELNSDLDQLQDRIINTFIKIEEEEPDFTEERLKKQQERLYKITKKNAECIYHIIQGGN